MRRSRHLDALLATVARDFIRATAPAYGGAVAVTYRELIIGRARLFRRPLLRRYRLSEIASVKLCRSHRVNRLMLEVDGSPPVTLMMLFELAAIGDFQRVVAAIERYSESLRSKTVHRRRSHRAALGALSMSHASA